MQNIDVEIQNFGKIKHAKFQIKPFTLIAGKNGSGKSFVTRGLYSVFSSLNKDHLSIEVDEVMYSIHNFLAIAIATVGNIGAAQSEIRDLLAKMQAIVNDLSKNIRLVFHQNTLASQLAQKDILAAGVQQLRLCYEALNNCIIAGNFDPNLPFYLNEAYVSIEKLEKLMNNPQTALENVLGQQLEQSLIDNFQVTTLNKLKNKTATPADEMRFNVGDAIGHLNPASNHVVFKSNVAAIDAFQQVDNVVYLESPMYWKIKDVLKGWASRRNDPFFRKRVKHQEKTLSKIPQYILDTFELLDTDVVQNESYPELIALKQTIHQCIGGFIQISDNGNLQFNHQDFNHQGKAGEGENYTVDLNQTATGATALGIVALLLDKNIIVPNSVLIFDEPEVNLHPAWQQVMIQVLYKLSLAGVNIVMASHSFDMMGSIEKLMDLHERNNLDVDDHFSIVQLDDGHSINHDKPVFKKLGAVKADLGMPLFDLFTDA